VAKLLSPCLWQNKNKKLRFAQNKKSKAHLEKQAARPDLRLVAFCGKLIMRILRRNEEKNVSYEPNGV
jgi:hypothetical protein